MLVPDGLPQKGTDLIEEVLTGGLYGQRQSAAQSTSEDYHFAGDPLRLQNFGCCMVPN